MSTARGSIVLATGNPHKVDELRAIFASLHADIPILGLGDLPGSANFTEPNETGSTFLENASIKATSYAMQTGRVCLADDSGLEIDALGGKPGVISSHYFNDNQPTTLTRPERDAANNERVLRDMQGVEPAQRSARFVCVMALAKPTGEILFTARGTFEGRIGLPGEVPRGAHGFGYDPLFLVVPTYTRTGAELDPDTKNSLSHRGQAARIMARHILASSLLMEMA